ncbi:DMT family transporter [Acetobacter syzygii]|mgnify:CR=1 FL=1|uniref:QacE family quaternary ammonium compound efflux SMR transporter n=1 Tax=Acetobacter syzygii TaxID=146476 RepID=A0A270BRE6_9PROT|nr:SMR family transporter [Acetobacter syzygii]PAL27311.1 QacE family quaternary ammonium compound efflux SMR transporter [Acetobacter syzygii]PAL27687.1 QacE family quaternary ammonium compound efflux SMR transporter [Acetobacter syzygii]GAN71012.1 quaternary ammonium compound-resistance protein EmrE [Acetobacter syzygii]GBR66205.1 quaternary ammonium compound resistance protein [Acetobacter syzygii NRIC 0483]GEL57235.1 multidrug transporter [Acetobacter syzygii]
MIHKPLVLLGMAIVAEVIGTACLTASQGFARWVPAVVSLLAYGCAFYLLSIPLKTIPAGVVYALWSGVGIVLISLIGVVFLKQSLDVPALAGIALILAGVLVINLFSSATH